MATEEGIFVVPVWDRWLIHAPLHHVSALVNAATVAALQNGKPSTQSVRLAELAGALASAAQAPPGPNQGPPDPEFVGLITTRACTMACAYCDFGAGPPGPDTMDLNRAVQAVDWLVEHTVCRQRNGFEVHFFGGEPSCAPDVIAAAVHRARYLAARHGLRPRFEMATNGFFDEDLCRFVGDYIDTVVLSLDGPQHVQDRHRPLRSGAGGFATVARNAAALGKSSASLCLRACVTNETVTELADIGRWFCETFDPSLISIEPLQPTCRSQNAGLLPPDPWAFVRAYRQTCAIIAAAGVTPVYGAALTDGVRHSFCPLGRDSLIVSPDGRISACYLPQRQWTQKGLDLDLGRIDDGGHLIIDPRALARVRGYTAPADRCRRCLGRWHCAGGCRVNHGQAQCGPHTDAFCIQTRLIIACALLDELGCHALADRLIASPQAMAKLALHPSDCLAHWGNA